MKKFTKIVLIIAVCMALAGVLIVSAGAAMAGGMSVLAQGLRSGELNFGNWHFEDGIYYKGEEIADIITTVEYTMESLPAGDEHTEHSFSEPIKGIKLQADLANVSICEADVESVIVKFKEGYLKYYTIEKLESTLEISYDVANHSYKQGPQIEIMVPKGYQLDWIEAECDLGNIEMEGCNTTGTCSLEANLGNITVMDGSFSKLEIQADLGNIEFSGVVSGDMTAQADLGNIDAEIYGRETDYNLSLSADVGDVTYNHHTQSGLGTSLTYRHENPIGDISLSCDMGDVSVSFTETKH